MTLTYVKNGDVRLAVETLGTNMDANDKPPVLFLHGFPEHRGAWRKVANALADKFTCLLPDLRGYRDSDKPQEVEAYTIDKLLGDVDALVNACTRPPILAGHDWGGVLAWFYAARHGERIAGHLSANAAHPALFQQALFASEAQRAASGYFQLLRSENAEKLFFGRSPEAFWQTLFARNPAFDDAMKEEYISAWDRPGLGNAMLNWYRAAPFIVPNEGEIPEMPAVLQEERLTTDVRTLVVWGDRDTVFLPELLEGLPRVAPNYRTVRYSDAGHAVIHEKPVQIAAAIEEFATP